MARKAPHDSSSFYLTSLISDDFSFPPWRVLVFYLLQALAYVLFSVWDAPPPFYSLLMWISVPGLKVIEINIQQALKTSFEKEGKKLPLM